jgi:eukaryotic-like serine/threonine-protein kinase
MSDGKRIGKYEIQSLLGKGSAATVFRGLDGQRPVALKILNRSALDAAALPRLREGTAALARVRHPAVVPFIEIIEAGNVVCFVYEFAEGEALAARMKKAHPDLKQTWDIARQLLESLEVAHGRGVFHGDLKPSNLHLDTQGRLYISDFGMAALAGTGTPHYMAPEQFGNAGASLRSDLYQVGAIVYHLVTGKLPFTGTREEVVYRIQQDRPTDPSSCTAKIAWQLDWVIQRALAKDPVQRFGSARELLDGLYLGLQDSAGTPLPPPAPAPAAAPKAAVAPKPVVASVTPAPEPPPVPWPVHSAETKLSQTARLIAKPAAANAENAADTSGKIRVLFVDDDERILNGLRALFRTQYHVFTADNGALAQDIVRHSAIQIVVSDQRMPGMTGVELLRAIRKTAPHTVRLLLTGYTDLPALVGSINEGEIFRFLKKPWDNDEIRATLAEAAALAAKVSPAAPVAARSPRSAGSILVIDAGQTLAKGLERLLAGEARVDVAATVPEAAKILQQRGDIAAIVADLAVGKESLVKLFKLLKEKRPEILSILVSKEPDSELVAELINQAQIYRFLAKPVNGRELRSHVSEALRRYAIFKQSAQAGSGLAVGLGGNAERLVSRSA